MLPLLDHFSHATNTRNGRHSSDGAIFLMDPMDDTQIEETKALLTKQTSWNHIMASSQDSFEQISDCLFNKKDPFSLHLNFNFDPNNHNNGNIDNHDNNDNLQCLINLNLCAIQLDLSIGNPLWINVFNHLNHNRFLQNGLQKLTLPRYLFTKEIIRKRNRFSQVFINFMNGIDNNKNKKKQRLLSLKTISIEMDDELLPSEQQYAQDFVFIDSINFNHPIYQSLNIYFIDRLQKLQCPFDIYMVIIYGLFCTQFPFLQNRAKKQNKHKNNDNYKYCVDEMFLIRNLKLPLNIQNLTIFPPIPMRKEMLLFIHSLNFINAPKLISLRFQNWQIGQIALFCKSIQRYTSIRYEYFSKIKNKHKRSKSSKYQHKKHKRSRSHSNNNKPLDIDRIIADIQGIDYKLQILKKKSLFHHIHQFRINLSSSSLFSAVLSNKKRYHLTKSQKSTKYDTIKQKIRKLYCDEKDNMDDDDDNDNDDNDNDAILNKKSLKPLLLMGNIIKYQFCNLYEFGLNHYLFLFKCKSFMISLLNGLAFHGFIRLIELQGIENFAFDLEKCINKSIEIQQENYLFIDKSLEQVLSPKDIRIQIMKYLYGDEYCYKGTGILKLDFSTNKLSGRRHSIFSALQTIKRRNDNDSIETKLNNFQIILESLERNWINSGLGNSDQYWQWKKYTKKIQNVPKIRSFHAM